ncbi:efflux RND transporter periplasmic adaptor subunit [Rhizosphaericola mali]|uniref:Efflux RND transporter periplasmic adaptor subunit n=1 Tax=Rhizosphaericola mali TaxID=2545455 RepID=A0A5P2FXU0_9BACT|nr:efflux RND transporter periplasmic adaptor subunit [Rhizosphaericola mali]QES88354.1 efflux RND transporter periplasmic adaptor subunit [Rhizosphaericola mali]
MKRKIIFIVLILLVVVAIVFKLSKNKKIIDAKNTLVNNKDLTVPVKVDTVQLQDFNSEMLKTGNVLPFKEAKILALGKSGTIKKMFIQLGSHVSAGQKVAVLDNKLMVLDLQKAEYHEKKLKEDLQTYTELLAGKAATQEKVNTIRQDYEDALNEVYQARKNINDANITAPTSGIISEKSVEDGMYVASGGEIATIVNLSRIKLNVRLTESEVYKIAKGDLVIVTADVYPGKRFNGVVDFINPQADEMHNYNAEILLDGSTTDLFRSGTFVYVHFNNKPMLNVMAIPRTSLTESIQNPFVYIVRNGKVHLQKITTNGEVNGKLIVTSGLQVGDIVVTSGQINLREGALVKISK